MNSPSTVNATNKVPLVAFEHYMLADERPTHPMTCHIRFWFRGKFERPFFTEALRKVLDRHPIFQMTIEGSPKSPTKDIYWRHTQKLTMPFISWGPTGSPIDEPPGGFAQNLYREIGLRLWIRDSDEESPTQTMLLVQFHHSVCDGIGMFHFLEDLLINYGNLTNIAVPVMRDIDPDVFARRGEFSLSPSEWAARRSLDMKRTLTFVETIAKPLQAPPAGPGELTKTADLFASERVVLPAEALARLRAEAREKNASVNELLIRDLFLVLTDWNAALGSTRFWTRIAIPTSLRGPVEEQLSAANVVSMVFLSRRRREIKSQNLLQTIVQEMQEIKEHRLGVALPRVFRRLGRYRQAVYRFLHLPTCSSTAVLTNLGRPFADSRLAGPDGKIRVGSICLESLETMPPVRPKTSASFSVNYYGGALSVTLRYDSTILTGRAAKDLLSNYCQKLLGSPDTKK